MPDIPHRLHIGSLGVGVNYLRCATSRPSDERTIEQWSNMNLIDGHLDIQTIRSWIIDDGP
jgi:hypothetical protein